MKPGDIVFVNGRTPISWLIRVIDGGPYSHVAVAVSDTHIIEAKYLTKVRISYMDYEDIEIIDLGLNDKQRDQIVHSSIRLVGRWYDYLQIVWYFFDKLFKLDSKGIWNSKNNLICSELVDYLLYEIGYISNDIFLGDVTPSELYNFLKCK
jgi:hypothetical protein